MISVEWVGGWLDIELLGPWPSPAHRRPVFVLLAGPFYVSIYPWLASEAWERIVLDVRWL